MKYFTPLLFITILLITSCKKEVEQQNSTNPIRVVPFTEVGSQMKNQMQTAAQQKNTTTDIGAAATGMNPAHGQAGHRCDIVAGAPLNSPAAANSQQNIKVPQAAATATPSDATPTPEGMNPPHGQTNHRCDIAVGAPLPKS